MPTDQQLIDFASLFNIDKDNMVSMKEMGDMCAMTQFVLDRLYENGDVMIKCSTEDAKSSNV